MSNKEGALSYIDTEHAPHWNPKFVWEPVDTHVIEAVPPKIHPYSKKYFITACNIQALSIRGFITIKKARSGKSIPMALAQLPTVKVRCA